MTRQCGDCGLCCKLPRIKTLDKPAGQWCPHWDKDKGCTIYEDRPQVCRDFNCLWLADDLPEKYSPLRTRMVAMKDKDGITIVTDREIDPTTKLAAPIMVWQHRGLAVTWAKGSEI